MSGLGSNPDNSGSSNNSSIVRTVSRIPGRVLGAGRGILTEFRRLIGTLRSQGLGLTLLAGQDKLVRMVRRTPLRRFTQLSPKIILGGQPSSNVIEALVTHRGVTGFVNMRSEYDYAKKVNFPDVQYLQLATEDNTAPSLENLMTGVDFIRSQVEKGGSVYIHCWEGLGRGPTMAAAYFVSTGMTPQQAWAEIRKVRAFIRPTKVQLDRLEEFAATYHAKPVAPMDRPVVTEDKMAPPPDTQTAPAPKAELKGRQPLTAPTTSTTTGVTESERKEEVVNSAEVIADPPTETPEDGASATK
jgi:protein-tyrosine phosphatase